MVVDTIDVIVTAPYRVDIAILHSVIRNVGDDAINQWCCIKSCQIPKLATYLVKSLFEERGMEIFERFSGATAFSKHVAEGRPELLPQLLAGALREGNNSCMDQICCRLLGAHCLQTGIPSGLPRFLEKLMRSAHDFPKSDSLNGMRDIVAIQSAQILDTVNEDILKEFFGTCKLFTEQGNSNWHEAAIMSVNIGSAICDDMFSGHSWPHLKMPAEDCSTTYGDWGAKMLKHLHGLKAPRLLHSIAARVMFFTSRNQRIPMLTRRRTLDVVFQTLERFRYGFKEFSDENPGVVEKVWRNAAGEELDFGARFSAFAVAYKMTPEGAYLDNIEALLHQLVAVIVSEDGHYSICFDQNGPVKAQQLTNALCSLLQHDRKPCLLMLRRLVKFILGQCESCKHPGTDIAQFLKTSAALMILNALSESMKKHKHVFAVMMDILDDFEAGEDAQDRKTWYHMLAGSLDPILNVYCCGSLVCARELSELSNQLRQTFIILLLHGACTTECTFSTKDFAFLQNKALAYDPKASLSKCQYPTDVNNSAFMPPPSLLPRVEGDWRQQIVDILGNVQRQSMGALLDHVDMVCHDFEARCDTVEEPLRQAESRASQLQDDLDRARTRLHQQETTTAVLMETVKKDGVAMDEKDVEIHALTDQITEIRDSAEQQNQKIAQLIADTTTLKTDHDSNITRLRAAAASTKEDLETANKAERFSWEEELYAEKQNGVKLGATIEWLESEKNKLLEDRRAEHESHQERVQQMKGEHEQERRELEERLQLAEEKEKKILAAIRGQEQE